jgi:hypothetical protein
MASGILSYLQPTLHCVYVVHGGGCLKGKDYLATPTSMIKDMQDEAGSRVSQERVSVLTTHDRTSIQVDFWVFVSSNRLIRGRLFSTIVPVPASIYQRDAFPSLRFDSRT